MPGSMDIGGTLQLTNSSFTLQISGTLTLEASGTIINPGTIKAAAFVNNGGTITGNVPVIGPLASVQLQFTGPLHPPPAGAQGLSSGPPRSGFALSWSADPGRSFVVESSTDLVHWSVTAIPVNEIAPGQYEVDLVPASEQGFLRVR